MMLHRTVITICLGSSCFRRGNQTILEVIKNYLIEHDLSDKVEFKGHLCTGNCSKGPVLKIDEIMYSGIDRNSIIEILDKHFSLVK